jgi:hypothetical protein
MQARPFMSRRTSLPGQPSQDRPVNALPIAWPDMPSAASAGVRSFRGKGPPLEHRGSRGLAERAGQLRRATGAFGLREAKGTSARRGRR